VDEKEYIVIDNGTGYIKAGFSGEDTPRCVIPTVVGQREIRNEQHQNDPNAQKYHTLIGTDAINNKADYDLKFPISRGEITDIDLCGDIWDHIFEHELEIESGQAHVLLTDTPLNDKENREKMAEILFEKFKVASMTIMNNAVLSLFSCGLTRGIVVESGEGVTNTVPVFEGYALPHAIQSMKVAGQDITQTLFEELRACDILISEQQMEVVQAIKEKMCSVALDYNKSLQSPDPLSDEARSFVLPDKRVIKVPHKARFNATEIMFKPQQINGNTLGLPALINDSINKCDKDLKIDLYNNVVLSGGNSMLPGYKERIEKDLMKHIPDDAKSELNIICDSQRKYASWIGGSMLASLGTFSNLVINKNDYQENEGKGSIVQKKTF